MVQIYKSILHGQNIFVNICCSGYSTMQIVCIFAIPIYQAHQRALGARWVRVGCALRVYAHTRMVNRKTPWRGCAASGGWRLTAKARWGSQRGIGRGGVRIFAPPCVDRPQPLRGCRPGSRAASEQRGWGLAGRVRGVRAGRREALGASRVERTPAAGRGRVPPRDRASGRLGGCRGDFTGWSAKIALPYYFTGGRVFGATSRVYNGTHEEHIFVYSRTPVYTKAPATMQMYIQLFFTIVKQGQGVAAGGTWTARAARLHAGWCSCGGDSKAALAGCIAGLLDAGK